ncbi:MAG: replication initiator protein A, partial [Firmicutes bacterium]|nr:replication initiator protein A [Bacillota bacterium]
LQVPMILVKDPIYHQGKTALNSDAILLYSFMLNRAKLSRKNGWLDEHNRVFIVKRRITRGGFGTLISAISPPGRRVRIGGDTLWAA